MFRSYTDGGMTFGEKINLSYSTYADSLDAELARAEDKAIM